jgi:nucleotide-binding universal stress UspA family protein
MGLGGTMKYAWGGLVDIRLAMIILAGSLFGIQLGAMGTTYVKPHMIKLVMGVIMIMALMSRAIVIPVYLAELDVIDKLPPHLATGLKNVSFLILIAALATGAAIIFAALWRGIRLHRHELEMEGVAAGIVQPVSVVTPEHAQLSPLGRFERFLVASDGSEYSAGAVREAVRMAQKCGARLRVIAVIPGGNAELYAMGEQLLAQELRSARTHLDEVHQQATASGVACETEVVQAAHIDEEIVSQAEHMQADLIVVGRRGRRGLARFMLGDVTARVVGHAHCSVLVVPRAAQFSGRHLVIASDGSRFGDAAAAAAGNLAKLCGAGVTVVSVTSPSHSQQRRDEARQAVNRIASFLVREGVSADKQLLEGRADEKIVAAATACNADLIALGSHGRTGLERVLLGSVAERVLNLTGTAVLVVRSA